MSRAWLGHWFGRWAGAGGEGGGCTWPGEQGEREALTGEREGSETAPPDVLGLEGSALHLQRATSSHTCRRSLVTQPDTESHQLPHPWTQGAPRQKATLSLGKHPRNLAWELGGAVGTFLKAAADSPESRQVGVEGDTGVVRGGGGKAKASTPHNTSRGLGVKKRFWFPFSLSCLRVVVTAVKTGP